MSEAMFAIDVEDGILNHVDREAHISYIESPLTAAGFPDMDICCLGESFKLEFKFSDNKTPPKMRPSQVKWFKKRIKTGRDDCFVLAKLRIDGEWNYCLIPASIVPHLPGLKTSKQWREFAIVHWEEAIDWVEFMQAVSH